jgi:hypothetical protein
MTNPRHVSLANTDFDRLAIRGDTSHTTLTLEPFVPKDVLYVTHDRDGAAPQ